MLIHREASPSGTKCTDRLREKTGSRDGCRVRTSAAASRAGEALSSRIGPARCGPSNVQFDEAADSGQGPGGGVGDAAHVCHGIVLHDFAPGVFAELLMLAGDDAKLGLGETFGRYVAPRGGSGRSTRPPWHERLLHSPSRLEEPVRGAGAPGATLERQTRCCAPAYRRARPDSRCGG